MITIQDYIDSYHPSWSKKLKIHTINENDEWYLLKRTYPDKELLHTQRILLNKKEPIYYSWQHINHNLHYCKLKEHDGVIRKDDSKWLGLRTFKYYETDINKILNSIMVDVL